MFRTAVQIAKGYPVAEPTQVGGAAALDVNDGKDAYAQLKELAEALRQRAPELTLEGAFARAYAENPQLAAKERLQNRPGANARVVG
jgi:hypothetical protein